MVLFIYGLVDNFSYNDYLPKRVMEKIYNLQRVSKLSKRKFQKEIYNKSTTKIPNKLIQNNKNTQYINNTKHVITKTKVHHVP